MQIIYTFEHKENVGAKKEGNAHWIDVNVQLLAIPKFHIFPKEKHAITGPTLFWDLNEWPAPFLNLREFFLLTFWNTALMMGIFSKMGSWRDAGLVSAQK